MKRFSWQVLLGIFLITLSAFFASFFNTMSMMVHGRKLTSLVRAAEEGDDDASE